MISFEKVLFTNGIWLLLEYLCFWRAWWSKVVRHKWKQLLNRQLLILTIRNNLLSVISIFHIIEHSLFLQLITLGLSFWNVIFKSTYHLKVGLSPSKKVVFICFNGSPLKMMKNDFSMEPIDTYYEFITKITYYKYVFKKELFISC